MLRRVIVLALVALPAAWLLDRLLARRWPDDLPPPLDMLVVIDAPIEATWAVLLDIPRQVEWMAEMRSVEVHTPGPVRVGTRAEATVRVLGIRVKDPVEVTELDPPCRYAIAHHGLFHGNGLITLEAGADGSTTIVRWTERLVPPLLPHLGVVIQAPILRSIFQADLLAFKRLVEADTMAAANDR